MKRPRSLWPAFFTAGLLLLIAAPAAPAQSKPLAAFQVGTDVFRRILFDRGFTALRSFNELTADPKHTILIVFGDANRLSNVPNGLPWFVASGGAFFLATDRALNGRAKTDLLNTAGVTVTGQSMVCLDTKDSCYREMKYCPFLQPVRGANPDLFRNLVNGESPVSIVASNAPSYLERTRVDLLHWVNQPGLQGLALLPTHCSLEGHKKTPFESPLLFAVGDDVGAGRVLVLADHSIFINEMMLPNDNGNVEFTYNCLEWLRGNGNDGRTKVLFVDDGQINSLFEVPLKEVPDDLALDYLRQHPDEAAKLALNIIANHPKETAKLALDAADAADKASQKIAPAVERKVQEVDERDGVNNGLLEGFADSDGLLRDLAVWLAVLMVLYGCYRIGWKGRHRTDLQGPLLATALHRLAPAGTVVEQRRRDLIRGDNLWEPARDLARQSLAAFGWPAAPPRIVVDGGWLRRWTMAGRVRRLWRLAYGPPARVSLKEWQRLLREVQTLKAALANGAVRFQE